MTLLSFQRNLHVDADALCRRVWSGSALPSAFCPGDHLPKYLHLTVIPSKGIATSFPGAGFCVSYLQNRFDAMLKIWLWCHLRDTCKWNIPTAKLSHLGLKEAGRQLPKPHPVNKSQSPVASCRLNTSASEAEQSQEQNYHEYYVTHWASKWKRWYPSSQTTSNAYAALLGTNSNLQ